MSERDLADSVSQGASQEPTAFSSEDDEVPRLLPSSSHHGAMPLLQDLPPSASPASSGTCPPEAAASSRSVRPSSPGMVASGSAAAPQPSAAVELDVSRAASRVLSEGQVPSGSAGPAVQPAPSQASLGQLSSGEDVRAERPGVEAGELPPPPCRCADCAARTSGLKPQPGPSDAADAQLELICWHTVEMMKLENATEEQKRTLVRQLQAKVPSATSAPPEPAEPFPFSLLPLELKLSILSHLTARELCNSAVLVCQEWSELARDPILWQHVAFDAETAISTRNVVHIVSYSTLLKSLRLEARRNIDTVLFQVADTCKQLRFLTAKFCDGLNSLLLEVLVKHCPLIEQINFEGSRFDDAGCTAALTGLKQLRSLNVSHCLRLDDAELGQIARQCNRLEELNVDGIGYLTDQAVLDMVELCRDRLMLLVLDGETLSDLAFSAVGSMSWLQSLSVSFADGMTDASLPRLRALTRLLRLKLRRGQQLTPAGLASLFTGANMPQLMHLDLSECSNVDDTTVLAITANCPLLTFLALSWCWEITDNGLESIVARLRFLRVLDLLGVVRITGACFSRVPECLPELRFLNLEQCSSIQDVVVERVVRRLPHLLVLDYYGDHVVPRPEEMERWVDEVRDNPQQIQLPIAINFVLLDEAGQRPAA